VWPWVQTPILSKTNKQKCQSQKDNSIWFHSYELFRIANYRNRKWNSSCQGMGGKGFSYNECSFSSKMKDVWKVGDDCTTMWMYLVLNCTLLNG
jgi:hypothetical protein